MCEVPPPESRRLPVKQAARQSAPRPERPPTKPPVKVDDLPVPLAPEPAPPPREPEFDFSDDPDDGKPYGVTGEIYKKCPQCSRRLEPKTTQCPGCGCDLKTGKKLKKTYTPVALSWETGWSFRKRLNLFVLGVMLTVVLGIVLLVTEGGWASIVFSGFTSTALMAFLLGTYSRVDLMRDQRGRITLSKTWRAFFVERPPATFNVGEFEGVRTGFDRDVRFFDWFIACMLLPAGIAPGIIWWYVFIQLDQHTTTLVREHGYGSDVLYRGVNEQTAKDIASALEEVARLPYENK